MGVFIVFCTIFLFISLTHAVTPSSNENKTLNCTEQMCPGDNDQPFYKCENGCKSDMVKIAHPCRKSFDDPGTSPAVDNLSGIAVTISVEDAASNSTQGTTVQQVTVQTTINTTKESVTSGTTSTTAPMPDFYCIRCPRNCKKCSFNNSMTNGVVCEICKPEYELNNDSRCVEKGDDSGSESSDSNVVVIVVACVCCVIAIGVVAIIIICVIRRKRRQKLQMTGHCQMRVVTSNELSDRKSKGVCQSESFGRESTELNKLPMAPAPPVGYDKLGIPEEEQLNYMPFDPSAGSKNFRSESMDSTTQDNVYMNVNAQIPQSAKHPKTEMTMDKSPRPNIARNHDSGSNSPVMDNVYTNLNADTRKSQNSNLPDSGMNNSQASLEMDDIYMNDNVEERRPSTSKSKLATRGMENDAKSTDSSVEENIYLNDTAQDPPAEAEQIYEVPEGAEPDPQSDVYINASDAIYENMN